MRRSIVLAAMAFAFVSSARAQEDCPADVVERSIRTAPTCNAAIAAYKKCIYGATLDVQHAAIAIGTCEREFSGKLSSRATQVLRAQDRCEQKYARESGTMYRSFAATCRAELARAYAKRYATGKAEKRKR